MEAEREVAGDVEAGRGKPGHRRHPDHRPLPAARRDPELPRSEPRGRAGRPRGRDRGADRGPRRRRTRPGPDEPAAGRPEDRLRGADGRAAAGRRSGRRSDRPVEGGRPPRPRRPAGGRAPRAALPVGAGAVVLPGPSSELPDRLPDDAARDRAKPGGPSAWACRSSPRCPPTPTTQPAASTDPSPGVAPDGRSSPPGTPAAIGRGSPSGSSKGSARNAGAGRRSANDPPVVPRSSIE